MSDASLDISTIIAIAPIITSTQRPDLFSMYVLHETWSCTKPIRLRACKGYTLPVDVPILPRLFAELTYLTPCCSIMPMETERLTEEQLIDFAKQHGCKEINHWKVERWHKEDVIPRPVVEHIGYGKGTRSTYPAQTTTQILVVCQLLKNTRKFDVVRFQLWHEGYPIPLSILKETVRQLVPHLKWKVPRREEQKYNAVERWLNTLLQKIRGPFFRFLLKRFGKNFENLQSFIGIQLSLLYGIRIIFEPSHYKGEPSNAEIFAQGLGLEELRFLSSDFTADFQRLSDQGLLSITKMNASLDEATEEDLRRANARPDVMT